MVINCRHRTLREQQVASAHLDEIGQKEKGRRWTDDVNIVTNKNIKQHEYEYPM